MRKIRQRIQFGKDVRKMERRGRSAEKLWDVIRILQREEQLPAQYHDHKLRNDGVFRNVRECHIEPDWLLVYALEQEELILLLVRTGTHADLFE